MVRRVERLDILTTASTGIFYITVAKEHFCSFEIPEFSYGSKMAIRIHQFSWQGLIRVIIKIKLLDFHWKQQI